METRCHKLALTQGEALWVSIDGVDVMVVEIYEPRGDTLLFLAQRLPEVVLGAMAGRPLSDIIDLAGVVEDPHQPIAMACLRDVENEMGEMRMKVRASSKFAVVVSMKGRMVLL